ncbi:hypothetical protein D5F52_26760 (plasmid) [Brevibacillus laterosporus]|uniref:hypothetical protein n=1 Tax=Brevibacillus laterosporus TaxID=1465 RepID=UPI000E6C49A6|nr:hypothetical protein [Brevibacillus laterosporus]AYB41758.1 hypothetical protein D5F52_26760 [Brevibacillus laterosporus]MBG9790988.1 hypothetical protein [Brevibacillus laterosporus]MBG9804889.1 hypothetical protein [Brevibacillus laterosporus]MED1790537.1 hypothetical protein [Brevibacillus laterosporus]MED4762102.1 hypothetical protein [Brevibacillus laterosporus]
MNRAGFLLAITSFGVSFLAIKTLTPLWIPTSLGIISLILLLFTLQNRKAVWFSASTLFSIIGFWGSYSFQMFGQKSWAALVINVPVFLGYCISCVMVVMHWKISKLLKQPSEERNTFFNWFEKLLKRKRHNLEGITFTLGEIVDESEFIKK